MRKLSQIYLVLLLIASTSGCTSINYYRQAVVGHLSLMWRAEPIDELLEASATPPALHHKLALALDARTFARDTLALPVGDAFLAYAELGRPWVVVNLVAVPEFSLAPHQWCYPVLGCQAYRGYYHLDDARAEEAGFRAQGYDTFIGGVTAYSTLGWFDDPLQSGFTALPDDRMVALMFHELAHRVVYIDGDTGFNESFATAVQLEGLAAWLQDRGEPARFSRALARLDHRRETQVLVDATTEKLQALYDRADQLDTEHLRARKQSILAKLDDDYAAAASHWDQPGPFGPAPVHLNNANLALFRQYNGWVNSFRQLFRDQGGDFPAFYRAVRALGEQPADAREQTLERLSQRFDEHLGVTAGVVSRQLRTGQ